MLRLRSEGLTWQQVDDELVVLDLDGSIYMSVNPEGTLLWHRLVEGAEIEELVVILRDTYAIDEPTARRDASSFVDELHARGLLDI